MDMQLIKVHKVSKDSKVPRGLVHKVSKDRQVLLKGLRDYKVM
jgi:hypothetical protein